MPSPPRCVRPPPTRLHPLTGQVAPCLPHAPHRGVLRLLPARRSQERVVLQLGEALGAVDARAEMGCHPQGVRVPYQTPTAEDREVRGPVACPCSPAGDCREGLVPSCNKCDKWSPSRSMAFSCLGSWGPPWERPCPAQGPTRLSYRGQQLLPPGEIWGQRGAGAGGLATSIPSPYLCCAAPGGPGAC